MPDPGLIFLAAVAAAAIFAAAFILKRGGAHAIPKSPYDTERLRREMIASAVSEEERDYLRELDALELHRRHLVC